MLPAKVHRVTYMPNAIFCCCFHRFEEIHWKAKDAV